MEEARQINNNYQIMPNNQLAKRLIAASDDAILTLDDQHRILGCNLAAEALFGRSLSELHLQDVTAVLPGLLPAKTLQSIEQTSNTERPHHKQRLLIGRHASGRELTLRAVIITCSQAEQPRHLLTLRDVTEQLALEASSYANNQRLQILTEQAPFGIVQIDSSWACVFASSGWYKLSGLNDEESLGRGWINGFFDEDCQRVLQGFRDAMVQGIEYLSECRLQSPLGELRWVSMDARPMFRLSGDTLGYLITFSDVTDQLQARESLRYLAHYDSLTGLANRTLFKDRLQHAFLRTARHATLALLFLDLDGFKLVNDTLGHNAGDALLKIVAQRIRDCVRKEDTVARLGGDEFTVILEDIHNPSDAAQVAEKIISAIKQPIHLDGQSVFVTSSIGIAMDAAESGDPATLIKQADIAMYRAKDSGRDSYCFFTPELNEATRQRMQLGNDLHGALSRHEFFLHYQPQIAIDSGEVIGAEALLRWRHPSRGNIAPDSFIPVLEESGLIIEVGAWLLKQACHQHAHWLAEGVMATDAMVSVNLSARQLRGDDFVNQVRQALQEARLSPRHLILEITESLLMSNQNGARSALAQLKELGITLSLDDFGTGYASLRYLKQFPIDHLKIDRSFVAGLLSDTEDTAITSAVIGLAQQLGIKVVAEGVDDHSKHEFLRHRGCDYYQGYLYSPPLPPSALREKLLAKQAV